MTVRVILFALFVLFAQQPCVADNDKGLQTWYVFGGAGYNTVPEVEFSFDIEIENNTLSIDKLNLDAIGDSRESVVGINFGVYWRPQNSKKMLLGGVFNIQSLPSPPLFDILFVEDPFKLEMSIPLVSASVMYFPIEVGRGPFVRADTGISWLNGEAKLGTTTGTLASKRGPGFLLAGGYAANVFSWMDVIVDASLSIRRIDGKNINGLGVTLNGLF